MVSSLNCSRQRAMHALRHRNTAPSVTAFMRSCTSAWPASARHAPCHIRPPRLDASLFARPALNQFLMRHSIRTPAAAQFSGPQVVTSQAAGKNVLILGAGVIGLTCALRLLQAGFKVTVVGHTMGYETTTAGAAGLWGPFKLWDTPAHLVDRWSGVTLSHLYDLLHSAGAEEAGVSLRLVHAFQEPNTPVPSWSQVVDNFTMLSPQQLARVNNKKTKGAPFTEGWLYHSIACEGGPYLGWLHRQIQGLGGVVLRCPQPLRSLQQLLDPTEQQTWAVATAPTPSPHPQPPALSVASDGASGGSSSSTQTIRGLTLEQYLSSTPAAQPPPPSAAAAMSQAAAGASGWAGLSKVDLVVNCSGIGAHQLLGDKAVTPIRGQVLRVVAPWVTSAYLLAQDLYVIPNNYSIVLGGTAQVGDWNTEPSEADRRRIVAGCVDMLPSLSTAVISHDWVGLRPGRASVRLELETASSTDPNQPPVIHNYGHGGSGLTLAWGCAGDVVNLALQL